MLTKKYLTELTYSIVGAAIEVHRTLGPGLLESVYHKCMKKELEARRMKYQSELSVDVHYKGLSLDAELRCDLLVEEAIVVELKAVEMFAPVHEAQILTYMKLLEKPKGILMNFTCANMFREGQRTFVNELFRALPEESIFSGTIIGSHWIVVFLCLYVSMCFMKPRENNEYPFLVQEKFADCPIALL